MTLEGVDNVERSDGLTLGVFGVGDGIANDALEERLEYPTSLFVDHYGEEESVESMKSKGRHHGEEWEGRTGRDTLDATTASQTTNGRFGDTLDVVTQDLAMTLRPSLAQTFASLSTCEASHDQQRTQATPVRRR